MSSFSNVSETAYHVDPAAYMYGGTANGADLEKKRYDQMGQAAQNRGLYLGDWRSDQTRQVQGTGLAGLQAAARGAPGAAQAEAARNTMMAMRGQQALAQSARGAAGIAGANYNAQRNSTGIQNTAAAQGAIANAQEQASAQNAYFNALGQARGQDMGQAQFDVDAQQRNMGQNDAAGLAYAGLGRGVTQAQLGASGAYQDMGVSQSQFTNDQTLQASLEQQKRDADLQNRIIGGAMQVGTAAAVLL